MESIRQSRVSAVVSRRVVSLDHDMVLLYTADVLEIARLHGVSAHSYADDKLTQLYLRTKAED